MHQVLFMESIQYLQEKFLVLMIMFECPGIPGSDQHSRTCSGIADEVNVEYLKINLK